MTSIGNDSLTMIGVFLMGLGLNLTPCVYPMLTVTLSLFSGQTRTSKKEHIFFKALIYVFGIATMYSTLGVIAALTGGLFGALLQSKWVLVGISVILFGLALSMFGVYTFQLPSWLVEKAGERSGKSANIIGIYLSGLLVGVFAAPCIGPPVIALLTIVGTRGDPIFAFWIFFVMSLGLGAPYLLLGTSSGLLQKLPRSGFWLVWVEHLFGTALLILSAFYLIVAFFPSFLSLLLPLGLIGGGIYLGFLERSGEPHSVLVRFKKIVGTIAILAGCLILLSSPKEKVIWDTYTPEKLASAKEEARPVIIDFYADWCIPCHELDQYTYSNANVIHALEKFRKFKVDLTDPDAKEANDLIERFNVIGVPTVVFLNSEGNEMSKARITGFVPPEELLSILNSISDATSQNKTITENSKTG